MSTAERILIIEDHADLVLTLTDALNAEGFTVESAGDGISGETKAHGPFHCIILDVMLPGRDGFQVASNLRAAGISTPILMLTARTTDLDTVVGLRAGADDYLAKPFDTAVLVARIRALIRRSGMSGPAAPAHRIAFGNFTLDTASKELFLGTEKIHLLTQEYRLLEFLARNPGRTLSREALLDSVWGYDRMITTRTVDVHVARLRERLNQKDGPGHIITVRGFGYRFDAESCIIGP